MWNMMCDVMPTISEDSLSQRSSQFGGDDANFEQLMVSMLDERDKLVDSLKNEQEKTSELELRLKGIGKERDVLQRQLNQNLPQEFATLTKELNQSREQVLEKDEEITELKAERNNTRLLLEHLECLVSRHERSLRMTVVKRQAASQSGVSSEVEVLKALKSLFEHHKALDEKVRERLRLALEKNGTLEEELETTRDELNKFKCGQIVLKTGDEAEERENGENGADNDANSNSDSNSTSGTVPTQVKKVNGTMDPEVLELRRQIEKHSSDLGQSHRNLSELRSQKVEMDEQISQLNKELNSAQELIKRLEIDLKENVAQKEDQEERIATLEKRYLNSQREATMLHDLNEKLEQEIKNKEEQYMLSHDKIKAITEKLDISEQKLIEFASMPDIEEQLKDRMEALTQAQERQGTAEERVQRLENQLEEKSADVLKLSQRLKMNEEHNQRLSATVDKLLSESNERLQVHLKERMHSLEEKNHLSNELERTKKKLEDVEQQRVDILKELQRARLEVENVKRQMLQQEIHHNIQQTEALTRNLSPGNMDLGDGGSSGGTLTRRSVKSSNPNTPLDEGWKQPGGRNFSSHNHVGNFESFEGDVEDNDSIFTDVMSPSGHTDAQTLACMLQEQLDAINNEIRLIQEEKMTTEQRAEELESRVGSVEHMNLLLQSHSQHGSFSSSSHSHHHSGQPLGVPPQPPPRSGRPSATVPPFEASSPPMSGRSTPKAPMMVHDPYMHKYHTLHLSTPSQEINREEAESQRRIMDGSPPTPRSLRLDRVAQLSVSQEELRRTSMEDSSHSTPSPMSSAASSQDSLHRGATLNHHMGGQYNYYHAGSPNAQLSAAAAAAAKKKGVKSTLGRIFGKKDKQLKAMKVAGGAYVTGPMVNSPSGGFQNMGMHNAYGTSHHPAYSSGPGSASMECDIPSSDSMGAGLGGLAGKGDFDRRRKKKHELLDEAMKAGTPFALWNGPTIVAWLELWVGMPAWYVAACRANVKSGAIMSALSDTEIQREIGISNPLHRLKLRLAIQEMVSLTSPSAPPTSRTTLAYGDMNHEWIGNDWLPSLGLSQYRTTFMECLVDARMLDHLTKKDLRTQLKLVDSFHRTSLQYGIKCLKLLNYDRDQLENRRRASENEIKDVLVWSNERLMKWVINIGLKDYANNLLESGVHGALIALDDGFDANGIALALQIPTQNTQARQLLENEYEMLLRQGTSRDPGLEAMTPRPGPLP
eukprot:maker-scaffold15_size728074-snap-gene-3.13 protein:Tk08850 transcript:maker-scaffold15_size728074-snap-gene-3.13-mRNA-1 annotation:"liprin-alpha-1 isoform x12"